jgi:hypothetical protein
VAAPRSETPAVRTVFHRKSYQQGWRHEPEYPASQQRLGHFTYASFAASAFLVAIGVYFLPVDLRIKGYLAMGIVMLIQSCVTLTKTVRDVHESSRLVNRIEDAKAERLLMEVSKTAA